MPQTSQKFDIQSTLQPSNTACRVKLHDSCNTGPKDSKATVTGSAVSMVVSLCYIQIASSCPLNTLVQTGLEFLYPTLCRIHFRVTPIQSQVDPIRGRNALPNAPTQAQ